MTDHRPLCEILGEKEGMLPLAAARAQRWALVLGAYQYGVEHTPCRHTESLCRLLIFIT